MPPKRKHIQKSPLTEGEHPVTPKRARGGTLRRTPRGGLGDSEPATGTSPASGTSLILPGPPAQTSNQQPSSSQFPSSLSAYRSAHLVCSTYTTAILADSIDIDDYKTQLYYFWGHVFILVRNLKTRERKEIFEATLPEFVQAGEMRGLLETEFDTCYRLFQKHFIKAIEEYGHQWLKSPACRRFREVELHARKQKRPQEYPVPSPPETGEDMLRFQEDEGLKWDYKCAIDFWSLCLPAFDTCVVPAKHVGWFLTDNDLDPGLAYRELSGVALELIRQFAIYEMRSPGGYSLEAHTHALRNVMPTILSDSRVHLYELPKKLGLSPATLGEIPSIPNYNLAPWAPEDVHNIDDFDDTKTDLDVSTSHLSYGALNTPDDVLLTEKLKDVDTNVQRVDEGLQPTDELSVRESDASAQLVTEVVDDINTVFTETLRSSLDDVGYHVSDYQPTIDDLAVPQLHAPLILDGPRMTKRAEMYASGNIWARQIMAQADRAIEIRRLNALLVAAQHAISLLELEERKFQEQITQLEEVNKFLSETWQHVNERIQQNKSVQGKRDQLLQESDSLEQSRIAQETGGGGGSFLGFQGLRFRDSPRPGSASIGLSGKPPIPLGDSTNSQLSFSGTRASTPGANQIPVNPYQSIYAHGGALPKYSPPGQHREQSPIQRSSSLMGQRQVSPSTSVPQGLGIQTIPARPTAMESASSSASVSNPSFLSRLGHHGQFSGVGNRFGSSSFSPDAFDRDLADKVSGVKGSEIATRSTTCDTSQPHTPHAPPVSKSPHTTKGHGSIPNRGVGKDSVDILSCSSNGLVALQENTSAAVEPESEVDDTTLLQATISAEQQLEYLSGHPQST